MLDPCAVREAALEEPLAHLLPAAELLDENRVEPRLVDPEGRVGEEPVAEEPLDVVALVRRAVAPDVDAVLVHLVDEHRPGHRPPEGRRVEVRLAARGDVERPAPERDQPLVDEVRAAVDEQGFLRADLRRASGNAGDVVLVVLAEIGGERVRDRPVLPDPGDRHRRVETAGERDPDAFADRERREDVRHRPGVSGPSPRPARAHPGRRRPRAWRG
jgi:hypothetical protein